MRAGAAALSLLATPLNAHILCALQEEERPLADLSQIVGLPPASTMRAYLRTLSEWGAVERKQEPVFPGAVGYELTEAGENLVQTAEVLQWWLKRSPSGGMALGSPAAKSTIKALVDGWDAAIVRALGSRPCALTELARAIPQVSYPTLERRLTAMRKVGLVDARRSEKGRGTPYGATRWLREGVIPFAAATAWERRYAAPRTNAIGRLDIEAALLLVVPTLQMPAEVSGRCRLAVELSRGSELRCAGVTATVEEGRPTSVVARLVADADAWVLGTARGWYRWLGGGREEVETGGNGALVEAVANALRSTLVLRHRV